MRLLLVVLLIALGSSAFAQNSARQELNSSLSDRAKWRSFGGDWNKSDPLEHARSGRDRILAHELTDIVGTTSVDRLKSLIALAEAGPKGYDAVHVGAARATPRPPSQMQLGEILNWIRRTPGQPHAIGRYQIIPSTLRSLIARSNVSPQTVYSAQVQDVFADALLSDAGLQEFQNGQLSQRRFMNNLAKIWAGLPMANGRSFYDGYAGNRATIKRSYFKTQMTAFFGVANP